MQALVHCKQVFEGTSAQEGTQDIFIPSRVCWEALADTMPCGPCVGQQAVPSLPVGLKALLQPSRHLQSLSTKHCTKRLLMST